VDKKMRTLMVGAGNTGQRVYEEAEQVVVQLKRCFIRPAESVVAERCDTD
jgi:hypothetical protein